MCGVCDVQVSVTRPETASNAACAARGSMGEAFCRFERTAHATRVVNEFGAARVGRAFDPCIHHQVARRVVAHDRRTIRQRGHRVCHGLEGIDLQNNALGYVLGRFLRCRDHHRDRIAEIAHGPIR